MISTVRSNPPRRSEQFAPWLAMAALLLACMLPAAAYARTSDRSQPVDVTSTSFEGQAKPNGVSHLKGNVVITQGTLKATSATATIHFDANSKVKSVTLKGSPAHVQQLDDSGNLVKGHANVITYDMPSGVATLTGDAFIKQAGNGTASGHQLVYNTLTGVMSATSEGNNRVHLTFQPSKAAPAAPASSGN